MSATSYDIKRRLEEAISCRESPDGSGRWIVQLPGPRGTILYKGTEESAATHKRNTVTTLIWIVTGWFDDDTIPGGREVVNNADYPFFKNQ